MIEKSKNETGCKKRYVSVWLETVSLDEKDVITTSQDSQAGNDITKDDIFGIICL